MTGIVEFAVQQGALFFGLIVLIGVAYLFFGAVIKKD